MRAGLDASTVTPASTPPVPSLTKPRRPPVDVCAAAPVAPASASSRARNPCTIRREVMGRLLLPVRRAEHVQIGWRHSWLAAPSSANGCDGSPPRSTSSTARCPIAMAAWVSGVAAASELAMLIRPKRARPTIHGRSASTPLGVPQRVLALRVAVRPPVDGEAGDVARRVEPAAAEGPRQLVAGLALEGLERHLQQLGPSGAALVAGRQARAGRHPREVQDHRLVGSPRALVVAEAHREVERDTEWKPPGACRLDTPSFWKAVQSRISTLV